MTERMALVMPCQVIQNRQEVVGCLYLYDHERILIPCISTENSVRYLKCEYYLKRNKKGTCLVKDVVA